MRFGRLGCSGLGLGASFVAFGCSFALGMPRAEACAPVTAEGHKAEVASEDALIVWNESTRHEDFIRRVQFQTDTPAFGFLVPTPSVPELAEVDDGLFTQLAAASAPKVEHVRRYAPVMGCVGSVLSGVAKSAARQGQPLGTEASHSVFVEQEARVAGLDAVTLSAEDPAALGRWLKEHDYAFRPALVAWAAPYVKAKWKITAFKYASRAVAANGAAGLAGAVTSNTLRMSFHTDRPYYPYREPADTPARAPRQLRLFILAAKRIEGVQGPNLPYDGDTIFASPDNVVSQPTRDTLRGLALPEDAWLTELLDRTTERPDEDVFFREAPAQLAVTPPPVVVVDEQPVFVPVELGLGLVALAWFVRRKYT